MLAPKILIIIPTYNEVESAPNLIQEVLGCIDGADILVVDDGSTDGTPRAVESLGKSYRKGQINLLQRSKKLGLGSAYIAGFNWGFYNSYELLIEMDADGSHRPEDLVQLLDVLKENPETGLVIGSRWTKGGTVRDWPKYREYLSRSANRYAAFMLRSEVKDMTSGFRVYNSTELKKLDLTSIQSQGYCFQIEMTRKVLAINGSVVEWPITFVERKFGASKMSLRIVFEAMVRVTLWGMTKRFQREVMD
jgi:dolichol-phosphate mannosyltransferase